MPLIQFCYVPVQHAGEEDAGSPKKAIENALVAKPKLSRSNSSPALINASRRRSKYDKCESITDVTQVLFSVPNKPQPTRKDGKVQRPKDEAKLVKKDAKCDEANQTKKFSGDKTKLKALDDSKCEGKPAKETVTTLKGDATQSQSATQQNRTSQEGTKRRHSLPIKRGNDPAGRRRKSSRSTLMIHQQNDSKLKAQESTERDQKLRVLSSSNKDASKSKKDLLSSFVTYSDQLPAPPEPSRQQMQQQYSQLPQHSPKRESVKKKLREASEICTIESSEQSQSRLYKSPESQRPAGGLLKSSKKTKELPSPSRIRLGQPRNVLPLVFDILRIVTIMFCTVSIISRSFTAFGGKMPLLFYLSNSPILWVVRWFIASFHVMFIILELGLGIPGILPNKTLDNWFQRGYLFSFIGLLDLCMNSNKSLEDLAAEIQDDPLTNRGIHMRLAFAALGISSRGLVACGIMYCLFALAGHNTSKRKAILNSRQQVGLSKKKIIRR